MGRWDNGQQVFDQRLLTGASTLILFRFIILLSAGPDSTLWYAVALAISIATSALIIKFMISMRGAVGRLPGKSAFRLNLIMRVLLAISLFCAAMDASMIYYSIETAPAVMDPLKPF